MTLDSRPRPVRRSARRRVHLFTTLTLLVMAAGLWFAGSASGPVGVPAPRLQMAEARVAAAGHAVETAADETATEAPADAGTPPVAAAVPVAGTGPVVAVPVAMAPAAARAVAGPRAPPRG